MNIEIPSCRICASNPESQFCRAAKVFGGQAQHCFWQCKECDAVYLHPVPSVEDENRFYTQEFEKFMSSRSGGERDWSGVQQHISTNQDQVKRRLPLIEPYMSEGNKVLEFGCSSGFMLEAFAEKGMQCVGVEPSGVFFEYLKEKCVTVYRDFDELEASGEKNFDNIVSFFVLEHIRDPFAFITKSMDLLNDGGVFIAEVPCVNDPLTSLYNIPAFEEFYWSIAHHYYYSPQSLAYVLDNLGLQYKMVPEQRYDLSNHIVWMTEGRPGGQGRYNSTFSQELIEKYKHDLKETWKCDTIFLYIFK